MIIRGMKTMLSRKEMALRESSGILSHAPSTGLHIFCIAGSQLAVVGSMERLASAKQKDGFKCT